MKTYTLSLLLDPRRVQAFASISALLRRRQNGAEKGLMPKQLAGSAKHNKKQANSMTLRTPTWVFWSMFRDLDEDNFGEITNNWPEIIDSVEYDERLGFVVPATTKEEFSASEEVERQKVKSANCSINLWTEGSEGDSFRAPMFRALDKSFPRQASRITKYKSIYMRKAGKP